jgi:hypothetical protein
VLSLVPRSLCVRVYFSAISLLRCEHPHRPSASPLSLKPRRVACATLHHTTQHINPPNLPHIPNIDCPPSYISSWVLLLTHCFPFPFYLFSYNHHEPRRITNYFSAISIQRRTQPPLHLQNPPLRFFSHTRHGQRGKRRRAQWRAAQSPATKLYYTSSHV